MAQKTGVKPAKIRTREMVLRQLSLDELIQMRQAIEKTIAKRKQQAAEVRQNRLRRQGKRTKLTDKHCRECRGTGVYFVWTHGGEICTKCGGTGCRTKKIPKGFKKRVRMECPLVVCWIKRSMEWYDDCQVPIHHSVGQKVTYEDFLKGKIPPRPDSLE